MTFESIASLLVKLLDVLLVWLVLYYILKNLRKNVKMVLLFKGVLIIVILKIIRLCNHLGTFGTYCNIPTRNKECLRIFRKKSTFRKTQNAYS